METEIVTEILALFGEGAEENAPESRARLRARLNVMAAGAIPSAAWPRLDALFAEERAARKTTSASSLPRLAEAGLGARISVWRGDLTELEVDAIVNAANSGLTGCYQPLHACVDNAIHSVAGPRLREACAAIMAERGRPEPTSTATLTEGFFLPARYVLHTVGPIVKGNRPTEADARALARCYEACLEVAAEAGITSVAFCSISTGVFGYPISEAAPVALSTVRDVLARTSSLEHVIFVAFSASDLAVYQAAAKKVSS